MLRSIFLRYSNSRVLSSFDNFGTTRCRIAFFESRNRGCESTRSIESNFVKVTRINEAPSLDPEWATADCKTLEALERSIGTRTISLTRTENVTTTNGVPLGMQDCNNYYYNYYRKNPMRICRSLKYATMIGTAHTNHWLVSRDPGVNWTEPLMSWTSSSDPYASLAPLNFPNELSAIKFCEKNQYSYYIERKSSASVRVPIVRRYEDNFHWFKRSRVTTR